MLGLVDSVFLKSVLTEDYFVANEKNELTQVLKKNKFNTRTKGTYNVFCLKANSYRTSNKVLNVQKVFIYNLSFLHCKYSFININ